MNQASTSRHLLALLDRYPALGSCGADISRAIDLLSKTFRAGNKLLVCGNGGSAADSEHIVGELMKSFLKPRPIPIAMAEKLRARGGTEGADLASKLEGALPAIALTSQVSLNTAVSNDISSQMVFAQQVYGLAKSGDVLLAISTSGNSPNVLNACIVASALELKTIALTGATGGRLASCVDVAIRVPATSVAEIQEFHLPVYHALCIELEDRLFP